MDAFAATTARLEEIALAEVSDDYKREAIAREMERLAALLSVEQSRPAKGICRVCGQRNE